MDLGLTGKVAIITGGTQGIGKATAERLAALESAPLVHPDRDAWRSSRRRLSKLARVAAVRQKRRAKLARQLKDLPAESAVWKKRVAVAALCEELPRLERLPAPEDFGPRFSGAARCPCRPGEAAALEQQLKHDPAQLPPEPLREAAQQLRAGVAQHSQAALACCEVQA